MAKKLTQKEVISRIEEKYPNKFDFSEFNYVNSSTKVTLICKTCGHKFNTTIQVLLKGKYGCPKCYRDQTKCNETDVIDRIKEIHGNYFDFSEFKYSQMRDKATLICNRCGTRIIETVANLVRTGDHEINELCPTCRQQNNNILNAEKFKEQFNNKYQHRIDIVDISKYVNAKTKIQFICNDCGIIFESIPDVILHANIGCPECANKSRTSKKSNNQEYFISVCKRIHNNKYDYSKTIYHRNKDLITIICPEHGEFTQIAKDHMAGHGCPICAQLSRSKKKTKTTKQFIEEAKIIHGNKYDYSKVKYIKRDKEITIICPEHGEFSQIPIHHLNGHGCPKCKCSSGENIIIGLLENFNIRYNFQYSLQSNTFSQSKMYIDFRFILNNKEYFIEYNGKQHYEPIEYFGGKDRYSIQKIRDEELRKYCKDNDIILIEIPYTYKYDQIKQIIINICDGLYN